MPTDPPTLTLSASSSLLAPTNVFAFDGQASVTQASVTSFPVSGFTTSCWIRTAAGATGGIIVSYDASGDHSHRFWIKNPENVRVGFGASTNDTGATGVAVNDGQWHQLAVTFAPGAAGRYSVGIYRDGVLAFFGAGAVARTADLETGGALVLGQGITGEAGLVAQMSEFRLWRGVQTANEIMTAMQVRAATADPNAVVYWALTDASTAGTIQGGSFVAATLQFRTRQFLATWTPVTGAKYDLEVWTDGMPVMSWTALDGTSQAVTAYFINLRYYGRVRAVISGTAGPWSDPPATAVPLDLSPLAVTLVNPGGTTVRASWSAVDQAQDYRVALYPNQGSTPTISTTGGPSNTTYDLTALVAGQPSYGFQFGATSVGSLGPLSPMPAATAAPALTFQYQSTGATTGTLQASWTAVQPAPQFYYLVINQVVGGNPQAFVTALLPGSQTTYTVQQPLTSGGVYTAAVRAISLGAINVWSATQQVTVQNLIAPLITSVTATASTHTVAVSWTYQDGAVTAAYVAELWQGSTRLESKNVSGAKNATFTNDAVVTGASLRVRVQATVLGSYGLWSAYTEIVVGAPAQVQNVSAFPNAAKDVQVSWSAVSGSGVTYKATLSGNGVDVTHQNIGGTTTTFTAGESHVAGGKTYDVTVWAVADGLTGPPGTTTVTIQQPVVPPNDQPHSPSWSDPINASSGSYGYSHADLVVPAIVPLIFITYYDSSTPSATENPAFYDGKPLGNRWSHSYNTKLVRSADGRTINALWGDLTTAVYNVPSSISGNYPIAGIPDGSSLVLGSDGLFRLTTKAQEVYVFTAAGALTTIVDAAGNVLSLTYSGGALHQVTEPVSGHSFTFAYDGNGCIRSVVDDSGRAVGVTVTNGQLRSIDGVMGRSRSFTYDGDSLLKTFTDENGNVQVTNTWTGKKVTFQQDARAVAQHQSYGSTLGYTTATEGDLTLVITDVTGRAGDTASFRSIQANGLLRRATYGLPGGNIRVVRQDYDGMLNLTSAVLYEGPSADWVDGKGNASSYTYDGNANLCTATDPLGRTTTWGYNARNFVTSVQDADGNTTGYHYEGNLLQSIAPPLGGGTVITYWPGTPNGRVKTVTDALGNVTSYEYTNGYVTKVTSPLGDSMIFSYNGMGLPHVVTSYTSGGAVAQITTYDYWAAGWVKTVTVQLPGQSLADGFVWSYTYDNVGNPKTTTDPSGVVTTYVFDPDDVLQTVSWPPYSGVTRAVTYGYDRNSFVNLQQQSAANPMVKQTWSNDQFGRPTTYTDPNGNATAVTTDVFSYAFGMLNTTAAAGPYLQQEKVTWPKLTGDATLYWERVLYDAAGRPVQMTDRGGNVTDVAYSTATDGATQTKKTITSVTLPPAKPGASRYTVVETRDALGRIVALQDERGKITTWSYSTHADTATNTTQSVVTITDPVNNQIILTRDALGRLVKRQVGNAAEGMVLSYRYDAIGRIVEASQQIAADTVTTTYSYTFNAATKRIDVAIGTPGSNTPAFVQHFNGAGQLLSESDALNNATVRTYAPWGSLASYRNARQQLLTYGFDAAGRLHTITLPDAIGVITQTLDANGNRLRSQYAASPAIVRTFDEWNRLLSRQDGFGNTVGYSYWPTGQVKVLTYPVDNKTVQYFIDGLQRLDHLIDWSNLTTQYAWYPTGQVQSVALPNGVTTAVTLDDAGNLTGIAHSTATNIIARQIVQLNSYGKPKSAASLLPIAASFPATTRQFTYGAINQLLTVDGTAMTYDADGNLTSFPAAGGVQVAGYDVYDNMTTLGSIDYGYDADGFLVTRTGSSAVRWVRDVALAQSAAVERADPVRALDGTVAAQTPWALASSAPLYGDRGEPVPFAAALDRPLEMRDGNNALIGRFLHGSGLVALADASGAMRYAHGDYSGNTIALTAADGTVTDAWSFDPFGNVLARSGTAANPFVFDGRDALIDDGTGVDYGRARSYAPSLLRFLQRDYLIGNPGWPQTLNRYAYVAGDPLATVDPLGLASRDALGVTIVLAVLAAPFIASRFLFPPVPPVPPVPPPPAVPPAPPGGAPPPGGPPGAPPGAPPGGPAAGPRAVNIFRSGLRFRGNAARRGSLQGERASWIELQPLLNQ